MEDLANLLNRTTGSGRRTTTLTTRTRHASLSTLDVAFWSKAEALGYGRMVSSTTPCTSTSSAKRRTFLPASFRPKRPTICQHRTRSANHTCDNHSTTTLFTLPVSAHGDFELLIRPMSSSMVEASTPSLPMTMCRAVLLQHRMAGGFVRTKS